MGAKNNYLIQLTVRLSLIMAAVFLLLFLANLRSRFYYHGPNYSFLLGMSIFCALTGAGLWKLRKWAVLLLFIPGVLYLSIIVYSWTKGARVPMPWALLNYCFVAALFSIPVSALRHWREFRW